MLISWITWILMDSESVAVDFFRAHHMLCYILISYRTFLHWLTLMSMLIIVNQREKKNTIQVVFQPLIIVKKSAWQRKKWKNLHETKLRPLEKYIGSYHIHYESRLKAKKNNENILNEKNLEFCNIGSLSAGKSLK